MQLFDSTDINDDIIPCEIVNYKIQIDITEIEYSLMPMIIGMYNNEMVLLDLRRMLQIRLLVTGKSNQLISIK